MWCLINQKQNNENYLILFVVQPRGYNSHRLHWEQLTHYPGNTQWAWTGEILSSCVKRHQERKNGQTLKFFVLNNLSCVRNNTCSKHVSYVDTAFSTESFLVHCTAPTGVHFDRGEGRVHPYMAYICGDGFCPLCPKHGVSKGWTTGNNRRGVKMF